MFSSGEAETSVGHFDPSDPEVAAGRVGRCHVAQLHAQASVALSNFFEKCLMLTGDNVQATAANCEAGVVPRSLPARRCLQGHCQVG